MVTGNELQVALRLKAQTEGKEDIDALGKSLSTLGAGSDDTLAALERDLAALTAEAAESATATGTVGQALQFASDAARGLNDQSSAMVAAFAAELEAGEAVTEALVKLAKALQLGDLSGIRQAGLALTALERQSKQAYEMILRSGKATTDELKRAFIQYAQDAIAANGGVASEALKIQAAMRGVVIETDAAGQSTVHLADSTNELRDAQQRPDSPPAPGEGGVGAGGGGGNGGGTGTGGAGKGKGSGDDSPPGTVKRNVFGFSFDNEQIGRANGVRDKDLSAFSEHFGSELQKQLAKMPRASVQSANTYRDNWNSAFLAAVKNANADAKRDNAPKTELTNQTVKVEITLPGGQKATVTAANKKSADDFVTQLKQARGTSI